MKDAPPRERRSRGKERLMSGSASRRDRVPYSVRVLLYYLLLFFLYRYWVHGYLENKLSRQLLGPGDTLLATLVTLAYLLLCALPPWFWSRNSPGRSLSRGLESYTCYAAVFLGSGLAYSLLGGESWKVWYGLTAGSGAWEHIITSAGLVLVFLASAWWGGRKTRRRRGRRGRSGK